MDVRNCNDYIYQKVLPNLKFIYKDEKGEEL